MPRITDAWSRLKPKRDCTSPVEAALCLSWVFPPNNLRNWKPAFAVPPERLPGERSQLPRPSFTAPSIA